MTLQINRLIKGGRIAASSGVFIIFTVIFVGRDTNNEAEGLRVTSIRREASTTLGDA